MYSNMKYYENICNCLRVIQQDINRKLKSANCWQQTSIRMLTCHFDTLGHRKCDILFILGLSHVFYVTDVSNSHEPKVGQE